MIRPEVLKMIWCLEGNLFNKEGVQKYPLRLSKGFKHYSYLYDVEILKAIKM